MILIVDDKPENIFSLEKLLKLHGFPVDSAPSGEQALIKVLRNSYALIILDVQMPVMDGFEVAETISGYSKSKDIPIIFLSAANTDKRFITQGYASGGVDYVTKPVDPDILLLKVKTFYRLFEQNKELNEMQNVLKEEIEFRKRAEMALNEKAQELRSILESLPQIAFTATANGQLEFVNNHWFEYASSSSEFPNSAPDEPGFLKQWEQGLQTKLPFDFEARIQKRTTSQFRCHWLKATPVSENGNVVKWVGTFTDIEERRMAEKKKDEFISIASHELKTPLTSIKAYIQLLQRLVNESESGKEMNMYIQRADKQIEKLNSLVTDLLDISKIESGKLEYHKKYFDFDQLVEHAIDIIQQTNKGFIITKKGAANIQVYGDENRIEQVILNYLTNAVKYSPVNKTAEVLINLKEKDVVLSVKDSGIGIPLNKQSQVFQKFYRAEEASERFQGLGIGLYICSEIIRGHGGQFGVTSEPGKGSEFFFTLPVNFK